MKAARRLPHCYNEPFLPNSTAPLLSWGELVSDAGHGMGGATETCLLSWVVGAGQQAKVPKNALKSPCVPGAIEINHSISPQFVWISSRPDMIEFSQGDEWICGQEGFSFT